MIVAHTTGAGFWQEGAGTLRAREQESHEHLVVFDTTQVTSPQNYSNPKPGDPCHPLAKGQHPPAIAYRTSGNSGVMEQGDKTAALNCGTDPTQNIIAYQCQGTNVGEMGAPRVGNQGVTGGVPFVFQERGRDGGRQLEIQEDVSYALLNPGDGGRGQERNLYDGMAVRRLTPRECERLQGFPDNWTNIRYGNPKYPDQICPDGPRYKALGNSMAIPPMRWLGERIALID